MSVGMIFHSQYDGKIEHVPNTNQITVAYEIIRGSPSAWRDRVPTCKDLGVVSNSPKKMISGKKNGPETVLIKALFL